MDTKVQGYEASGTSSRRGPQNISTPAGEEPQLSLTSLEVCEGLRGSEGDASDIAVMLGRETILFSSSGFSNPEHFLISEFFLIFAELGIEPRAFHNAR